MATKYKIKLPIFEGPFDLLLYLIKKNEIDIYDIPIAEITHQYLEYLEVLQLLDLDVAGEFVDMVATLMLIKVRMLLPQQKLEGEEEIEDPRSKLVSQLLEYQQYKEVANQLGILEHERKKLFPSGMAKIDQPNLEPEADIPIDATLFDLLTALKIALDNMPKVTVHQVNIIKVTIEDRVDFIFKKLKNKPYILFREMTAAVRSKMELIVTFMALLDLIRLHFIKAKQPDVYGDIRLIPINDLNMGSYLDRREKELLPEAIKNN
jgi:segregation and condensation protein A